MEQGQRGSSRQLNHLTKIHELIMKHHELIVMQHMKER